ncbi:hypothetical protein [Novosphingobium sp. PhB165]|uniref:hypothetical protein n=1 Tax=Novosphingobium sp. PhB165 TaxID=2485105 RepID=UPI001053BAF0|nr:hypothetical protein [Novosphingobium sp. PhB165]
MTCPVGGEKFTAATVPVYSIMGRRPDGQPYSEVPFPHPIPECPGNGLVVFADFTAAETQDLARWIATPVYQAMRTTESPFYRAYWLARKIGRPDADALELLLPAIWSAKGQDRNDSHRPFTTRYQQVLVNAVNQLPASVPADDRIWLQAQAANALREMGEYAKAERMRGLAASSPTTRPALTTYLQDLQKVIARHDRSDEPLDMIPDVQAAILCKNSPPKDAFGRAYCAQPSIAGIFKQST